MKQSRCWCDVWLDLRSNPWLWMWYANNMWSCSVLWVRLTTHGIMLPTPQRVIPPGPSLRQFVLDSVCQALTGSGIGIAAMPRLADRLSPVGRYGSHQPLPYWWIRPGSDLMFIFYRQILWRCLVVIHIFSLVIQEVRFLGSSKEVEWFMIRYHFV